MPGQHPSELAQQQDIDRLEGLLVEQQSRVDRGDILIRQLQGKLPVYDSDQIGTVKTFAGQTIPANWMLAAGQTLLRADYPELFAAIGTAFGSDSAADFKLPNLTSRFIYGAAAPNGQGAAGGAATHTLTAAELAAHGHGVGTLDVTSWAIAASGGGSSIYMPALSSTAATYSFQNPAAAISISGATAANTPAGGAHNNMPPYVVLAFIIKVTGAQINAAGALVGPQGPPGNGLLGVQTIQGQAAAYQPFSSAVPVYTNGATIPLQLSITPTQDVWWDVTAHVGLLQKVDAAYHHTYLMALITPLDVDGVSGPICTLTQHSGVDIFGPRTLQYCFKLAKGVSYTVACSWSPSGGSWQYYQDAGRLYLQAKTWSR